MTFFYDYQLLNSSLIVGAILFALGTIGFVSRRNLIVMFLSAGLMVQGILLTLAAFGSFHANLSGELFSLFVLAVAAVEGAVSLAMLSTLIGRENSWDVWQADARDALECSVDSNQADSPPVDVFDDETVSDPVNLGTGAASAQPRDHSFEDPDE